MLERLCEAAFEHELIARKLSRWGIIYKMHTNPCITYLFLAVRKMKKFLESSKYVNYNSTLIIARAKELFREKMTITEKAQTAYYYVRDEIPHSFDCNAQIITATASDVLKYKTGICHAKANLLAALLRSQGIPTGFCYQHITLVDDDSKGYCLHCYNAVQLGGMWVKVDARGNTNGKNA